MDKYHSMPKPPEHVSGTTVLIRLVEGLGFRFHWATEGLRDKDFSFSPSRDCMSIEELIVISGD